MMKFFATILLLANHLLSLGALAASLRRATPVGAPTGVPWRTREHALYYGDHLFRLKGINWNGVESECRVVHGLWESPMAFYMDILQAHDFNALRLPIPWEAMDNLGLAISPDCATKDPHIAAMNVGQFIGEFLDDARRRNMFVLFDLHSIEGQITDYPWTDRVSEEQVVDAWVKFATAFAMHPAVMGFEIKNEPHGNCTTTEFHVHAAKVIDAILKAVPAFPGLFVIDGTSVSPVDEKKAPWGGTFETIVGTCEEDALCQLGLHNRIVFAPHVYGPDVRGEGAIQEDWRTMERRFGFMKRHAFFNESAIVVTEFGGHMKPDGPDYAYFDSWRRYMHQANLMVGAFFWTFPPSSGDTGGFLTDDWRSPDPQKIAFLHLLQPFPSKITY